jgi:putative aminopeptidase FrvX
MNHYDKLRELVEIDSPTGFTAEACKYIFNYFKSIGYQPEYTNKGAVKCSLGEAPAIAMAAHVDTLGAIVSGIQKDGHLKFSLLGGLSLNGFEGEYCRIHTHSGKVYSGTLLLKNPSVHANKETNSKQRSLDNMFIRLDEEVSCAEDTKKLGISNGDIIAFDTKYQELDSGYIKSRFMDNKAGCYVLMELARRLKEENRSAPVELFFSNYEEVGHGGTCGYASTIKELLVIDMGVIGDACEGQETKCSICAKDSSGPYDYEMRKKLVDIADKLELPYAVDVYPYYGSDGSAALRAGNDFRVGLIGPGVAASHGMERTHKKGIEATVELCLGYLGGTTG